MANKIKNICVLGSTGSVGVSTLDVVKRHPGKFAIEALSANSNVALLEKQCIEFKPRYAVMVDEQSAELLSKKIKNELPNTEVLAGKKALETIASLASVDYVMAAIVGSAGLLPNLAAAKVGKRVMLANKESLVMSGQLFIDAIKQGGAELLPIDSEHNAIFQVMPTNGYQQAQGVEKILLTGSGGPFRTRPINTLSDVTPEEAIAHPNWNMGKKISVDSATMMNKGLELIEAAWLFDRPVSDIDVIIHPQSTIHSMVAYSDGSVLAQMGNPDMRTPIAYALAWPERIDAGVAPLNLFDVAQLDFEKPDYNRFPCLKLAYEAYHAGGNACIALNAANEIAVDAFLNRKISFTDIPRLISKVLDKSDSGTVHLLDDIILQDSDSRDYAKSLVSDI